MHRAAHLLPDLVCLVRSWEAIMPLRTDPGKFFQLTDDELKAVGRVAIEWSHLEFKVENALWHLLGLTEIGNWDLGPATTTHIPFRVRLDMVSSLVRGHELSEECVSEWDKLLTDIGEQHKWRNLTIHHEWHTWKSDSPQTLIYRKARKGVEHVHYEADLEHIEATGADIIALRKRLEKWIQDHIARRFSLRKKSV